MRQILLTLSVLGLVLAGSFGYAAKQKGQVSPWQSARVNDGKIESNKDRGAGEARAITPPPKAPDSIVTLSPQIAATPISEELPIVSMQVLKPFLSKERILNKDAYEEAPYVVAPVGDRLAVGSNSGLYVSGIKDAAITQYSIYRMGRAFYDPEARTTLGYEGRYIGDAVLRRVGDPSLVYSLNVAQPIIAGDRLFPKQEQITDISFEVRAPRNTVEAMIIDVIGGVTQIGQFQTVLLNLGDEHGIKTGHILSVFQTDTAPIFDSPLVGSNSYENFNPPPEVVGQLMIYRTFPKLSFAIVTHTKTPLHVFDKVGNIPGTTKQRTEKD